MGNKIPPALIAIVALLLAHPTPAQNSDAVPLGPTRYLSFADSPLNVPGSTYFWLEDFEDQALDTLGVTPSPGWIPLISDSVDGDDGSIDGSSLHGYSYYSGHSQHSLTLTFNPAELGGHLPTHAGIVWTDVGSEAGGYGDVLFQAFDASGKLLKSITAYLGEGSGMYETDEDRFFGVIYAAGIGSISISMSSSTDWTVDHLQYGCWGSGTPTLTNLTISPPDSIPENSTNGYTCRAEFSDGTSRDVSAEAQWSITEAWATPPNWRFEDGTNLVTGEICTAETNITIQVSYQGIVSNKVVTVVSATLPALEFLVTGTTETSFTLGWAPLSPGLCPAVSGYEIDYREFGLVAWNGVTAVGDRQVISGLKAGTLYEVRLRPMSPIQTGPWTQQTVVTKPVLQNLTHAYVQTVPFIQNGIEFPEEALKFVTGELINWSIGEAYPSLGLALNWTATGTIMLFEVMAQAISQIGAEEYPDVWIQSVAPMSNRHGDGLPVVVRGEAMFITLVIDTRGKTKAIPGEVWVDTWYWPNISFSAMEHVVVLTASEAAALEMGTMYLVTLKQPLSSSVPAEAMFRGMIDVEAHMPGKYSRQTFKVVFDSDAPSAGVEQRATLQATDAFPQGSLLSVSNASLAELPATPRAVTPLAGFHIQPDGLEFTNGATLTIHRQPGWASLGSDGEIWQWAEGRWNRLPTRFVDWSTTDPNDDVWVSDVSHLCDFVLVQPDIITVRCERQGGQSVISWDTSTNRLYTVERATNLAAPAWLELLGATALPGTGGALHYTNSLGADQMFFRIRVE